ncbi:MAG: prolyl aminopeptidase [Gammaproteobacteria bacterium]|nr:MAG: prolyl aminopeptidase [Gammaproteobacteria bacterium]
MRTHYPAITPYETHQIPVSEYHTLYVEECGNRDGLPVLFVHGGPGAGCSPSDRCFFNPDIYRIIVVDQRGSGRSTPHASLDQNTTADLIADMELIREKLKVEQWMLFGGSWGSTLSLLYAQSHPHRVTGMVLRGIFLCRREDIDWFYQYGASAIFPDYWADFVALIELADRDNMLAAYYRHLTSDDELDQVRAAKAWSTWEARCATLHPNSHVVAHLASSHVALAMARIEAHYFMSNCFVADNQILDDIDALGDIPAIAVHGRYDVVCPVKQAFDLQAAWPQLKLEIIRDAGHASSEPGTVDALVKATDEMAAIIKTRQSDTT